MIEAAKDLYRDIATVVQALIAYVSVVLFGLVALGAIGLIVLAVLHWSYREVFHR
jgi:hypothetical protein